MTAQAAGLLRRGDRGFGRLVAALFLAGVATFALLYATQPLLPLLAADFGVTAASASLTVSVATGALAVAVLPVSLLSERRGRVPVMTAALAIACMLGLAAAAAPDLGVLLAVRGVQGIALAGLPALAVAYLGERIHPGSLGQAVGLYVAGTSIGGLAGRLVATAVAGVAGWRWAMLAIAAATVLCVAGFRLALPAGRGTRARSRPAPWATLRAQFSDPGMRLLLVVPFLLMGGFVAVYNYLVFRLVGPPFNLPEADVGYVFIAYLAGTGGSAIAGRLTDRYGRRWVLVASIGLFAAGALLTLPADLGPVAAGLIVLTAGFFAAHSTTNGWVAARAGAGRAQAAALYTLSYYLGSSVLGWLGGLPYGPGNWPALVGFVLALLAIAVVAVSRVRPLSTLSTLRTPPPRD